jgi:hypothetical protein
MTRREIQTASLMMESGFHDGVASPFERVARLEFCPPISVLAAKDNHSHSLGQRSIIQIARSAVTHPITPASLARDHFQQYCKPDSIPI